MTNHITGIEEDLKTLLMEFNNAVPDPEEFRDRALENRKILLMGAIRILLEKTPKIILERVSSGRLDDIHLYLSDMYESYVRNLSETSQVKDVSRTFFAIGIVRTNMPKIIACFLNDKGYKANASSGCQIFVHPSKPCPVKPLDMKLLLTLCNEILLNKETKHKR